MNWIIWAILGIALAVVIVIFREDIWDFLLDGIEYIISFEWLRDLWEFITGMFENLDEFSVGGLIFASMSAGLIYVSRNYMLGVFTQYMTPTSRMIWTIATYISCFILGYLVGKKLFDD